MAVNLTDYTQMLEKVFEQHDTVSENPRNLIQEQIERKAQQYKNNAIIQKQKLEMESNVLNHEIESISKDTNQIEENIAKKKDQLQEIEVKIQETLQVLASTELDIKKKQQNIQFINELSGQNANDQLIKFLQNVDDQYLNSKSSDFVKYQQEIQDTQESNQILTKQLEQLRNQYEQLNEQIYNLEYKQVMIDDAISNQQKIADDIGAFLIKQNFQLNDNQSLAENIEQFVSQIIQESKNLQEQQYHLILQIRQSENKLLEDKEQVRIFKKEQVALEQALQMTRDSLAYVRYLSDSYKKQINQISFENQINSQKLLQNRQRLALIRQQRDQVRDYSIGQKSIIPFKSLFDDYTAIILIILALLTLNLMMKYIQ